MAILNLTTELRDKIGTRASRALRESGYIPATLYSNGKPAASLKLESITWTKALSEELHLVKINVGDQTHMVTVREVQRDPLSQKIIHVDLLGIKMDEAISFHVKVEFVGNPIGVKEGGVLSKAVDHIEVECLPTVVPDSIEVDISKLNVGESIHASDLVMPEGVTLASETNTVLASVVAIRLTEAKEEEAEEGAEEKKEEEEEKTDD
ncbi:MAG TPA: 50S ribosomal protein L25 [Firmicutes bacterium]|nr:50S ribosomal protein L25 [Bacillota bacterium]